MQQESGNAGTTGALASAETLSRRERARAAAETAASQMRTQATHAADWARSRYSSLDQQLEMNPRSAALLALGVGIIIGLLLRGRRAHD